MRKWFWVGLMWVLVFVVGIGHWDPDYGWHVRMGQTILESGIPITDPFSYTMSRFPFVDHEWLTNVGMYGLHQVFGIPGVAFVAATIVAATLYLVIGKRQDFLAVPMVFGIMAWVGRAGVRPQILDWGLFALMLWLYESRLRWVKWRWVWPGIVAVWVNLHGGFALGVVVLLVMIVADAVQRKKIDWGDISVWGLSLVATFVGPYGIGMWREVVMQMSDSKLKWTIAEWVPFFITFEMTFWLLVTLCAFLLTIYWKKIAWWRTLVFLGVTVASMVSVRHVGLAFVVIVPLTVDLLQIAYIELVKDEVQKRRWKQLYVILLWVALTLVLWFGFWTGWGIYKGSMREKFYPVEAVKYLRGSAVSGKLFSEYGWGGYLIWNLPDYKLFIDGRMPSWRYSEKECEELEGTDESCWAMRDFEKVRTGDFEELFAKYDVQTVLLARETNKPLVRLEWVDRLIARVANFFGLVEKEEKLSLVEKLVIDGWEEVYKDQVAIVLVRR